MCRCIPLLILLSCQNAVAQGPANVPPILVLDSGGHTARSAGIFFTPDGRELISVSHDKTIRTWDVKSGEPLRVLRPPIGPGVEGELSAAALSSDGRLLAVGAQGPEHERGRIYVLSLATGRIQQVLDGHTEFITSLALTRKPGGGYLLASGGGGNVVRLWETASDRDYAFTVAPRKLTGHTGIVTAVAFAPDGGRLATASTDNTVLIWSLSDRQGKPKPLKHEDVVRCVAWSPDGATLASGGRNGSIRLWHADGSPSRSLQAPGSPVITSITFSANSKELLYTWTRVGSARGAVFLNIESEREPVRFAKHDGMILYGALSRDGSLAATAGAASSSHEIYLWKTSDGSQVQRLAGRGRIGWSVGWSADGGSIAWGNTLKFSSDNDRGPLEHSFRLSDLKLGVSRDNAYHRAAENRGSVSLKLAGPRTLEIKQGDDTRKVGPIALFHCYTLLKGDRAAAGTDAGNVLLFDTRAGTTLPGFESLEGAIWAVAPSPDGRYLLTASGDQTLRIWDVDRDRLLLSLFFAANDWIAWTPEGYYAASPGGERLVGWQVSNGPEQVGTFLPASRFHKSLYRPDVIKRLLTTGSVARAVEVLREERKALKAVQGRRRRSQRRSPLASLPNELAVKSVQELLPPVVRINDPNGSVIRIDRAEMEVHAVATAHPGQPVTALTLQVDGRPYEGDLGRKVVADARATAGEVTESWKIRLTPGKYRLAVVAESAVSSGRSDEIQVLYQEQLAAASRLYVVAIGVSKYPGPLSLRYAADDAQTFADVVRAKSAPLFEKVEIEVLLDEAATRENVIGKLTGLRKNMRDGDVGLVFFSGHGAYRDDTFFMLSVDANVENLESSTITADLFKKILTTTKGRLIVLLDACHSGAETASLTPLRPTRRLTWSPTPVPVRRVNPADALHAPTRLARQEQEGRDLLVKQLRPSTDDLARDLSSHEHGVITMSSSTDGEVSVESKEFGHGYFTQALIEGISGKADSNKDGEVYVNELDSYLSDRVKDLSKGRQNPVTAKPASVRPFALTRP